MADDLEGRLRSLESNLWFARGAAAAFGAVGLGIGALALFAFNKAQEAVSAADSVTTKTPVLIDNITTQVKEKFTWKRVVLTDTEDFDSRCMYRFAYRNHNSDLVIEYAVEVAGKTLSGAITTTRFFNLQAGDRGQINIYENGESKFKVEWLEKQCT